MTGLFCKAPILRGSQVACARRPVPGLVSAPMRSTIWLGIFIGSTVGGFIPELLGRRHAFLFGSAAQWPRRLCRTVARVASVKVTGFNHRVGCGVTPPVLGWGIVGLPRLSRKLLGISASGGIQRRVFAADPRRVEAIKRSRGDNDRPVHLIVGSAKSRQVTAEVGLAPVVL